MSVSKAHPTASVHVHSIEALKRALVSGHRDAWIAASRVWRNELEGFEGAQMALAALLAIDDPTFEMVIKAILAEPETPLPPFWSAMSEASDWAGRASYSSVKACALAAFNRLSISDQNSFLEFVAERRAA